MAFSFFPDPLRLCRKALDKIENGVNSLVARKMDSKEFAEAVNQLSKVAIGVKHMSEQSLACVYRRLEVPTRSEVNSLAATVERIEHKLDQILPPEVKPDIRPRPARTRRPEVVETPPAEKPQARKTAVKRASKAKAKPVDKAAEKPAEVAVAKGEAGENVVDA